MHPSHRDLQLQVVLCRGCGHCSFVKEKGKNMAKWKGQWRIAGQNGKPNLVSITDGDMTWDDIDEATYRLQCIRPPLEDLPWRGGVKPAAAAPTPPVSTPPIKST